jgi:lipid II isoglutaminyl synthase (glutamine-hydrolysing)
MTTAELTLAHLYPAEMNIYGDRGNVMVLQQRSAWRGIDLRIVEIGPGDPFDPLKVDLVFGGGGQDAGQIVVAADLQARRHSLLEAAEAGVVLLSICGTYQLLGRRFVTATGEELPGIGLFGLETTGGEGRLIGNVIVDSPFGRLVGFENHGGRTRLDDDQEPLGRVTQGHGNNGETGEEGAQRHNAFGTYLHGPILPKNPAFADELLRRALRRRDIDDLEPLDDRLELAAADTAAHRPQ